MHSCGGLDNSPVSVLAVDWQGMAERHRLLTYFQLGGSIPDVLLRNVIAEHDGNQTDDSAGNGKRGAKYGLNCRRYSPPPDRWNC